ncbi:MAG: NADH-ubiquinone oxidoreductase subunit NDUFA12 family protein [Rickettsiales bacterium]
MTIGTRLHTLFFGKYVGSDDFGNRYYISRSNPRGARERRWVLYKGIPEPSKVPPLWHGWLHHKFDDVPSEMLQVHYNWEKEHQPNLTGTKGAYAPPGHLLKGQSCLIDI